MKFNNRERLDLTEWIIHFIHDRKPEDDISSLADIAELEGRQRMSIRLKEMNRQLKY